METQITPRQTHIFSKKASLHPNCNLVAISLRHQTSCQRLMRPKMTRTRRDEHNAKHLEAVGETSAHLQKSLINSEKQTTAEFWVPILGNQEPTTLRPNENFHFPFPRDFEAEARISNALFPTSLQDEKIAPIKWFIYARHMHNIYSFWQTLFPWIVSFLATNERQKLKFHFVWESPCKSGM